MAGKSMWPGHMGEKRHSQVGGMVSSRWIDGDAVARQPAAVSDRMWLRLFGAMQVVVIAAILLWPRMHFLPYLCDGAMASLTMFFAGDRLRTAKPDVRLIWTMIFAAMALLSIGHLFQSWILLGGETSLPRSLQMVRVSPLPFGWYSAFISARLVPFVFLFAQIEENDDTPYFRLIDALQSVLIIYLVTLVYSPTLLGAPALPPRESVLVRGLVFALVAFFGVINWLGRPPGYGRQLIGAITLYLLAKFAANEMNIILDIAPIFHGDRSAPTLWVVFETLPHLIFVITALHKIHWPQQARPSSGGARKTIRFLNPVCFTIASFCLAILVVRYNQLLGGALILLSVLLYVLRSAKWQSDFRRLKVEASAAEQARADFLLDINHEIRSPLTTITLNASRLNREAGLSADQAILVKKIYKGADFVISILNNILDMSRMEAGALRVPLKPFDAGPVIGEVIEQLEHQAEHRDIVIDWRATSGPLLLGDANRLRQVLTNILANAIHYAPQHSKIVVEMKSVSWSAGPAGRITVTDFGEGIPQSKQELLFRRFPQLGENVAGGLGLAISSALMNAMGGTIAFESEPGRTSFWIELRQASSPG